MTSRVVLEAAYVLHRRPYRDSSLIIDALTAQHGRVALVARGARRAGSRLRGVLQSFRPLLLSWAGRGELGTLTGAEACGGSGLPGAALVNGFYVNELMMRLMPRHDPYPGLYTAYETVVGRLAEETADRCGKRDERALRLFEKTLLRELGYGLALERDALQGAPIRAEALYYYYLERGAVPLGEASVSGAPRGGAVELHGQSLLALAREELDDERSLREVKRLMRAALAAHLGDRPLHSRSLLHRPPATRSLQGNRAPRVKRPDPYREDA